MNEYFIEKYRIYNEIFLVKMGNINNVHHEMKYKWKK